MSSTYNGNGNAPSTQGYARKVITNATNANPIVVTTSANHGFTSGDTVVQEGVLGNLAANGRFVVTVLTNTTYSIPVAGSGAYTSGGYAIDYAVAPMVTIPSDGDDFNAAAFNPAYQGLQDKAPFLYERVGAYRLYQVYTAQVLDDLFASYSTTVNSTVGITTVSTTTGNGVSPIEVTTTAAHGYQTGQTINVASVGGNTAANGTWVITVTSSTKFTLGPTSTGNGAYTSGGSATNYWGNLSGMTGLVVQPVANSAVCNPNDVFEVFFSSTITTNGAGPEAVALGFGSAGSYYPIAGSAQRFPASYSGPITLVGKVKVGDAYTPQFVGQSNIVFDFSVMDQGNAGSPVTVNLLGYREVLIRHLRPN